MRIESRLYTLKRKIGTILNDDTRYAISERIRELGYIDLRDFFQSSPINLHVVAVERMLMSVR